MSHGTQCAFCHTDYSAQDFNTFCEREELSLFAYADLVRDGFDVDARVCVYCGRPVLMVWELHQEALC
jgi:hypothetical protein